RGAAEGERDVLVGRLRPRYAVDRRQVAAGELGRAGRAGGRGRQVRVRRVVGVGEVEGGVAARVRGNVNEPKVHLALAVAGRVVGRVGEELDAVRRAGRAAQVAEDRAAAAEGRDLRQDGEVLEVVGPAVAGRVVERDAVVAEVDSRPGVGEDGV